VETLDFHVETQVAMRHFATSPTLAEALKRVCEHIGLELIEYDTGSIQTFPGENFTRVTLRSRLWRERLQRAQLHARRG
jgi:hypothetical protein